VLLAERVERLEQAVAGGVPALAPAANPAEAAPAAPAAPPAPKRTLGAVRSERAVRATESPEPEPARESEPAPEPAPPAAAAPHTAATFDLDDVVLAWATILPNLPMATRSQVQHAQPIDVDGDIVVFGVAPRALQSVQERFRIAADPIREALVAALGGTPRFKLVASEAVDLAGAPRSSARAEPTGDAPPPSDEEPPDDVESGDFDPGDFVDAEPAGPAVSSVGLLEAEFGATVVEERPRQ
jgi:hypothetical protein